MRRTIAVLSVVAVMVATSVAPAFAAGLGPSACKSERPGQLISDAAREEGLNGDINPGNARSLPTLRAVHNEREQNRLQSARAVASRGAADGPPALGVLVSAGGANANRFSFRFWRAGCCG